VHCASWVKREAKLRIYFKHFSKQTFFKTNIFQNKHFLSCILEVYIIKG
jgi:hypothetical protein